VQKVQAIGGEIPQALFDEGREVAGIVSIGGMRVKAAPGLGSNDDFTFAVATELRDEAFAASHAVDIRRVYEIDPTIDGVMQSGEGLGIGNRAPGTAQCPGAEAD